MPQYRIRTGYSLFKGEGRARKVIIGKGQTMNLEREEIKGQEWKVEEVKVTQKKAEEPAVKVPEPKPVVEKKAVTAPPVDRMVKEPPVKKDKPKPKPKPKNRKPDRRPRTTIDPLSH